MFDQMSIEHIDVCIVIECFIVYWVMCISVFVHDVEVPCHWWYLKILSTILCDGNASGHRYSLEKAKNRLICEFELLFPAFIIILLSIQHETKTIYHVYQL